MDITITEDIVAAVTLNEKAAGGGLPIFYAKNEEEQIKVSRVLANIVKGMVHDLENGTFIIVRH